ncbi:TPA: glycosyltransferase family 4 protein [Escherichia coli]|nr:glycosyltransferase family 4 protein [Escherichia coli]HAH6693345.1 glycosyltransferase family 4 protein [Escherichia coli]
MSVKNILFIDSYYNSLYGAQKSMINLALQLKEKNINVTIASMHSGFLLEEARNNSINTYSFNFNPNILKSEHQYSGLYQKITFIFLLFFSWIRAFILHFHKLKTSDVICVNDIRTFLYLFPLLMLTRKKNIWYIRIREEKRKLTFLFSFITKIIIFISSDVKKNTKIRTSVLVYVLMTGFPRFNLCYKKRKDNNEIRFVTVGSLNQRKNQVETIDLFKKIKHSTRSKCTLDIIGAYEPKDFCYYKELNSIISNDPELNSSVFIHGYCENILNLIEDYDVFLFSSLREGLPRSIIEALHAGLFVITRPVDGVNDILLYDYLGTTYTNLKNIPFEFCDIADKWLTPEFRLKRNQYINEKFNNEVFVDNFLSVLDNIEIK